MVPKRSDARDVTAESQNGCGFAAAAVEKRKKRGGTITIFYFAGAYLLSDSCARVIRSIA